jgi:hypothetical protein
LSKVEGANPTEYVVNGREGIQDELHLTTGFIYEITYATKDGFSEVVEGSFVKLLSKVPANEIVEFKDTSSGKIRQIHLRENSIKFVRVGQPTRMLESGDRGPRVPGPERSGIAKPSISRSARQRASAVKRRSIKEKLPVTLADMADVGLSQLYINQVKHGNESGLPTHLRPQLRAIRKNIKARMARDRQAHAKIKTLKLDTTDTAMKDHGIPLGQRNYNAVQSGALDGIPLDIQDKIRKLRI